MPVSSSASASPNVRPREIRAPGSASLEQIVDEQRVAVVVLDQQHADPVARQDLSRVLGHATCRWCGASSRASGRGCPLPAWVPSRAAPRTGEGVRRIRARSARSPGPSSARSDSVFGCTVRNTGPRLGIDHGDHDLGPARSVEHDPVERRAAVATLTTPTHPCRPIGTAYCRADPPLPGYRSSHAGSRTFAYPDGRAARDLARRVEMLLGWDQLVTMPAQGAAARAQQLGDARPPHPRACDRRAEIGDWLEELDGAGARRARPRRRASRAARLGASSAGPRGARGRARARRAPRARRAGSARAPNDDFEAFAPALERNVELARAYGECVAEAGQSAYDALLGDYDFGLRVDGAAPRVRRARRRSCRRSSAEAERCARRRAPLAVPVARAAGGGRGHAAPARRRCRRAGASTSPRIPSRRGWAGATRV